MKRSAHYDLFLEHPPTKMILKDSFWNTYGIGVTISVFVVCAGIAPILFTRSFTEFDFTNTGQIGDTIGGLTAPIIGVLNAVLLWWTLRKQGQQISEQNLQNRIERKINKLEMLMQSVTIQVLDENNQRVCYKGQEVIFRIIDFLSQDDKDFEKMRIDRVEWQMLLLSTRDILQTAIGVVNLNLLSRSSLEDKISLYVETDERMSHVFELLDQFEIFNQNFKKNINADMYLTSTYTKHFNVNRDLFNRVKLKDCTKSTAGSVELFFLMRHFLRINLTAIFGHCRVLNLPFLNKLFVTSCHKA